MTKRESGIIRLFPLFILAVLLIGVIGYVSIKEIKNAPKRTVLSDSDTRVTGDNVSVDDLDKETQDLESESQKSESELEFPEIENPEDLSQEVIKQGNLDVVKEAETLESTQAGLPKLIRVRGMKNVKLLGILPIAAPITLELDATSGTELSRVEPEWLKLLSFLFTK